MDCLRTFTLNILPQHSAEPQHIEGDVGSPLAYVFA
jgi:hypothetical protein